MTRIDVELRSYFATPVILATLPDPPAVNAELRRVILERERQDEDRSRRDGTHVALPLSLAHDYVRRRQNGFRRGDLAHAHRGEPFAPKGATDPLAA